VCFGRDGYAGTRISDIAAEAGMSPAGFYRHFPDKQALLFQALAEPLAALLAATGPLTEHQEIDADAVRARNTEFFAVYAAHRRVLRVLREVAALHEEGLEDTWLSVRRGFVDRIALWLHSLARAGRLHTADVDVLADALGGVLEQLAYTRLGLARTEPSAAQIETMGRVSAEIWVAALTRAGN